MRFYFIIQVLCINFALYMFLKLIVLYLSSVHFIYNIEYPYDSITTGACKLITAVAEIYCEGGSTQSSDLGTGLEHIVGIKYFDLVGACTSWDNQITGVLLELRCVDKTRLIRWKTFVPIDIFNMLTGSEVPQLKLLTVLMRACQHKAIMKINWITTNIWSINWSAWTWLSNIPHFDILVPTSRDNKIRIVLIKLAAENSITVAWFTWTTTLEVDSLLPRLLIEHL